jgi:hypothetical protein
MNSEFLTVECADWREEAEIHPDEMEVIMEMMIEAEVEICS